MIFQVPPGALRQFPEPDARETDARQSDDLVSDPADHTPDLPVAALLEHDAEAFLGDPGDLGRAGAGVQNRQPLRHALQRPVRDRPLHGDIVFLLMDKGGVGQVFFSRHDL